jgi:UDP-N-acetylmuramoyl-tripeptide--D-alanyl-D-alanine ligase
LGDHAQRAHLDIGAMAANSGLATLVTVGLTAKWIAEAAVDAGMEMHRVLPVGSAAEAAESLRSLAHEGDMVLLKGSRKLQLEKILESF